MAMYDEEKATTLRQGVIRIVWIVAAVAALWLGAWLVFFRDTGSKTAELETQKASQDKSSQTKSDKNKSSSAPDTSKTSDKTTTPNELANTGPGNVLAVAGVASVAGTAFYYIRLRKKLTS